MSAINYSNSVVDSSSTQTSLTYDFTGETEEVVGKEVDLFIESVLDLSKDFPFDLSIDAISQGMDTDEFQWTTVLILIDSPLVSLDFNLLPFVRKLDKLN